MSSFDGDSILWQESRPAEKGRNVIMQRGADGTLQELNPRPSTRAAASTSTAAAPT